MRFWIRFVRGIVKKALIFSAVGEGVTGLSLVLAPSLVGSLLLGEPLAGVATSVARVAALAMIGLGIAIWPGPPRLGMAFYSTSVAVFLAYLGVASDLRGALLWPAVGVHILISILVLAEASAPRRSDIQEEGSNDA
jgi:hypothetical protein